MNGIAVDTTSVPSDAVLDVKIFSDGYYAYQVDQTGLADPASPQYGGFGGYGTFEYNQDKNVLTEYQEWGSGQQLTRHLQSQMLFFMILSFIMMTYFYKLVLTLLTETKGEEV